MKLCVFRKSLFLSELYMQLLQENSLHYVCSVACYLEMIYVAFPLDIYHYFFLHNYLYIFESLVRKYICLLRLMDCRNGSRFTEANGSPSLIIDRSDSIAARATSKRVALSTRLWLCQHMVELC